MGGGDDAGEAVIGHAFDCGACVQSHVSRLPDGWAVDAGVNSADDARAVCRSETSSSRGLHSAASRSYSRSSPPSLPLRTDEARAGGVGASAPDVTGGGGMMPAIR